MLGVMVCIELILIAIDSIGEGSGGGGDVVGIAIDGHDYWASLYL